VGYPQWIIKNAGPIGKLEKGKLPHSKPVTPARGALALGDHKLTASAI
jgi:hypothetical protein